MNDIIKMAIKTLMSNKLRTALSMLGIVVWVMTIILVVAIWQWAQASIEEQYKNLSVTTVMVMPVNTPSSTSKVSDEDVVVMLEKWDNISEGTSLAQGKLPVSANNESEQFTILGTKAEFPNISNLNLVAWRFFTEDEDKSKAKVVVLGNWVVDDLFGWDTNIIWETVVIGKKRFELIGVFESSGATVGPISYDDSVYIPYTTATKITLGSDATIRLLMLAKDINSIDLAMSEMGDILRDEHNLKAADSDDFRLRDQGSKVVAAQESAKTMSMLLAWVAAIVLIVSGIGIMNVMFAWVAERTKEIWILKSVWAKNSDVLNQFLIESVVLTVFAGIVGIVAGELLIPFADGIEWVDMLRSNQGDIVAFVFSGVTGVFFGWYPAYKASKLDPVDALRS